MKKKKAPEVKQVKPSDADRIVWALEDLAKAVRMMDYNITMTIQSKP